MPVRDGDVATIVTTLELRERTPPRPLPPSPLRLVHWPTPALDRYRALFRRVGAPWLWFSRLTMDEPALSAVLLDPGIAVFAAVDPDGAEAGMLELDFRRAGDCEISYFALVAEMAGQGHGRWLMAEALARAWRENVARVWLHTCTLDHPSALNFYRAQGFVAVKRTVETFADPRATGLLPPDAAPHVPLLSRR